MVGSVRFKIFVLTVSSLLLSGSLYGVPYELSDGGRLVETNGKPVDGPIDIGVKFYSSATGSEPVAGVTVPNFTSVTLNEGVFQLVISLTATEFHIILTKRTPRGSRLKTLRIISLILDKSFP